MSRNQTGGTELIPMPHPTEAAQLSLPIILYSALHGCALHGFHFHHHVSPGLIPCNYGKNHAVHGTCHGSA